MPQEALEGGSKEILGLQRLIRPLGNFRAPQSRLRLLRLFLPLLKKPSVARAVLAGVKIVTVTVHARGQGAKEAPTHSAAALIVGAPSPAVKNNRCLK